tara:strand:+ start:2583 stop:3665 length:1083 start_codon:yes stop_codon:yes gene_type:complete
MARNRVIYQSDALFIAKTGSTTMTQLHRIQSANYSFEIARQDINQFGQLAAIDRIILEQPTVSLDFSYYPTSGLNEARLGFDVDDTNTAIKGMLSGARAGGSDRVDVHNYFITTKAEGVDQVGNTDTPGGIVGIGNGFLTSYSAEGSVGDFVTASVNVEGLNLIYDTASSTTIANPAVNPADGTLVGGGAVTAADAVAGTGAAIVNALRPGDVALTLPDSGTLGYDSSDLKVQNFSFNFDLSRENIEKLGSKFAFAREIEFPTSATLDASSIIGDYQNSTDGDGLSNLINNADPEHDITVTCAGFGSKTGIKYQLKGAKLNSHSVSSSIGDNKSLDLSFEAQVGGPEDTIHGIVINTATT